MSGWKVKVVEAGKSPRFYAVAEADPRVALIRTSETLNAIPPRDRVETVEPLSTLVLEQLGVPAGKLKEMLDVSQ